MSFDCCCIIYHSMAFYWRPRKATGPLDAPGLANTSSVVCRHQPILLQKIVHSKLFIWHEYGLCPDAGFQFMQVHIRLGNGWTFLREIVFSDYWNLINSVQLLISSDGSYLCHFSPSPVSNLQCVSGFLQCVSDHLEKCLHVQQHKYWDTENQLALYPSLNCFC